MLLGGKKLIYRQLRQKENKSSRWHNTVQNHLVVNEIYTGVGEYSAVYPDVHDKPPSAEGYSPRTEALVRTTAPSRSQREAGNHRRALRAPSTVSTGRALCSQTTCFPVPSRNWTLSNRHMPHIRVHCSGVGSGVCIALPSLFTAWTDSRSYCSGTSALPREKSSRVSSRSSSLEDLVTVKGCTYCGAPPLLLLPVSLLPCTVNMTRQYWIMLSFRVRSLGFTRDNSL